MLNSQKVGVELYENLGKLFYAIAMADSMVHIKELDKLKEIVRESWLDVDDIEDRYHSDAAYRLKLSLIGFWNMIRKAVNASRSLPIFIKSTQNSSRALSKI